MEQLFITNYQKEDLTSIIMESMKKALNDFALENKHQETEKEEILSILEIGTNKMAY